MATMGVAPSDSGEEEGREMKNRAANPLLTANPLFEITQLAVEKGEI